jgi:hypothetical protein
VDDKPNGVEALSEADRRLFDSCINDEAILNKNSIAVDIARKHRAGWTLSEKQLNVLMRLFRVAKTIAPPVDSTIIFLGKIVRKEQVSGTFGLTTKYVFRGVDGVQYNIKTTNKRLCPQFDAAFDAGIELKIQGTVVWVSPDNSPVCLSGRAQIVK